MEKESSCANELVDASSLNIKSWSLLQEFHKWQSMYNLSMTGWTEYAKTKLDQFKTPRTPLAAVERKFLAPMSLEKSSAQRIGELVS